MDFVHDQLARDHKIRALTVMNTFSRLSPAIDPRFSYKRSDVVQTRERLCLDVGFPKATRIDQGSEFTLLDFDL